MAKPKLTNDDFCRASKRLKCEAAAIKAVAEVESRGNGFYTDGFPVILFERHKFRSFTGGNYNESHPQISGPAGNYGSAGQNQKNKFNLAFKLDPEAAMKSCSWGKFQIMGFNHKLCGFETVGEFVDAMKESEGRQLDAFVEFVINTGLADELRRHEWDDFAQGYNGATYKKNKYDTKMAAAYRAFAKENIDCSKVSAAPVDDQQPSVSANPPLISATSNSAAEPPLLPSTEQPIETKTTEAVQTASTTTVVEQTTPAGDPPHAAPTEVSKNGGLAKLLAGSGMLTTFGTMMWGYFSTHVTEASMIAICVTLLLLALMFRHTIIDAIRMQTASDPNKKNVS